MSDPEPRRPRRRRRSWLASLVGAGALLLLGFGAGLVVGASFEDPDLVAAALGGRTDDVELPLAARADAPLPEVAARPPLGARAPAAPPPVRVPAPASGGFSVQVGAFGQKSPASLLAVELKGRGFPAFLVPGQGAESTWRVRVGPVATRGEAERLAQKLKRDEGLPTWVVGDGG